MKRIAWFASFVFGVAWLGCSTSSIPEAEPTGYDLRVDAFFDATIESDPRNTYSEIMRVALSRTSPRSSTTSTG